jgi:hypothetical protein
MRVTKSDPGALCRPKLQRGGRITLPFGKKTLVGTIKIGIGALQVGIGAGIHVELGVRLGEAPFEWRAILCDWLPAQQRDTPYDSQDPRHL